MTQMEKMKKSGLWQPTGRLKGQVCSLTYEMEAVWRRSTFIQVAQENFRNGTIH